MPYVTKPYIYAGIGGFARLIEYVIDQDSIIERGAAFGNVRASVKRDGANVFRVDDNGNPASKLRNAFPFGNLKVTNSGGQHIFRNVPDIDAFTRAVRGTHPDVFPAGPAQQDASWQNGLVTMPYEVQIPYPPKRILDVLKSRARSMDLVQWNVKPGDRVRGGTPVGNFKLNWQGIDTKPISKSVREQVLSAQFYMPYHGIVRFVSRGDNDQCLFAVQPLVKEEDTFEYLERYRPGLWREEEYAKTFLANPKDVQGTVCQSAYVIINRTEGTDEYQTDSIINEAYTDHKSKLVKIKPSNGAPSAPAP